MKLQLIDMVVVLRHREEVRAEPPRIVALGDAGAEGGGGSQGAAGGHGCIPEKKGRKCRLTLSRARFRGEGKSPSRRSP